MRNRLKKLSGLAQSNILLIIMFILIIGFGLANGNFISMANLISVTRQAALFGIMACGLTFVLIGGNVDLSIGALLSLTCCMIVKMHDIIGPEIAILVVLGVGILSGVVTGYLVGYLKLSSLITTLGIQTILNAITMLYTNSMFIIVAKPDDTWFRFLGRDPVGGIPTQIIIYLVMTIIFQFVLKRTLFGYRLLAVGGNAVAGKYAGINDQETIMRTYIISGFCAAVGGVVYGSRSMFAQVGIGDGFEFEVLTACVVSGVSMLGGFGSVTKCIIGVLIMGILKNGFVIMGLPYYTQWLVQCIIILLVVWLDVSSRKKVTT